MQLPANRSRVHGVSWAGVYVQCLAKILRSIIQLQNFLKNIKTEAKQHIVKDRVSNCKSLH